MPRPPNSGRVGRCKVCASGIKELVDTRLEQRVALRDIETETGLARSTISKHKIRCLQNPEVLEKKRRDAWLKTLPPERAEAIEAQRKGEIPSLEGVCTECKRPFDAPVRMPKTQQDVVDGFWAIVLSARKMLADAEQNTDGSPGWVRALSTAIETSMKALQLMGRSAGLIKDGITVDNRTVTIFEGLSDDRVDALIAKLEAKEAIDVEVVALGD